MCLLRPSDYQTIRLSNYKTLKLPNHSTTLPPALARTARSGLSRSIGRNRHHVPRPRPPGSAAESHRGDRPPCRPSPSGRRRPADGPSRWRKRAARPAGAASANPRLAGSAPVRPRSTRSARLRASPAANWKGGVPGRGSKPPRVQMEQVRGEFRHRVGRA